MQKSPLKIDNKKTKVLIVDDEVFISEQLNAVLIELGYRVTAIAYNTSTAIESLKSNPPDIAVLDIKMHGENQGFAIAKYIREHMKEIVSITTKIHFILFTRYKKRPNSKS